MSQIIRYPPELRADIEQKGGLIQYLNNAINFIDKWWNDHDLGIRAFTSPTITNLTLSNPLPIASGGTASATGVGLLKQIQHTETAPSSDAGQTIASQAITTTGGKVLIMASVTITVPLAQAASQVGVTRGGTSVPGAIRNIVGNASFADQKAISITGVDSPVAGAYTYSFTVSNGITIGSYELNLLELNL